MLINASQNSSSLSSRIKTFKIHIIYPVIASNISSLTFLWFEHSASYNPLYINMVYFFVLILLPILLFLLFIKPIPAVRIISSILRWEIDIITAVTFFIIAMLIWLLVIFPWFFPSFEITEPNGGSYVDGPCTISGHGAIPGSSISVYVKNDYGSWFQGTTIPIGDGRWEKDVTVGQDGRNYGKKFRIYAITNDGMKHATPSLIVYRSNV